MPSPRGPGERNARSERGSAGRRAADASCQDGFPPLVMRLAVNIPVAGNTAQAKRAKGPNFNTIRNRSTERPLQRTNINDYVGQRAQPDGKIFTWVNNVVNRRDDRPSALPSSPR